ncbi:hypothetical protein OG304_04555 [Streptomyces sp. NBC_00160]|uniref:hypothetical protein n=1 Tax=Streptomyces sp. NBC_00160 TaxID=2903628 RepID=UPI0022529E2E|nr:hypothetical protein [Streptomyces sp. NBC_00160]MCX5302723.1 hypothetical protein [Streptomyces sp. NBC_00160]
MTDPSPAPRKPGAEPVQGRPRWVNVFALIVLALILVFVIVHLAGGGMGGHS